MRPHDLLVSTLAGLCCRPGGFHIDPLRPVDKALITHGHSDHARPGHGAVLATQETLDFMRLRYGDDFAGATQAVRYGETLDIGGVTVSFHPAGHVLGSAQIRVAHNGLYCRHGCAECLGRCSEGLAVSTIMRYSYYFTGQGREKEAMGSYARLGAANGARCLGCSAPCDGACPYGVDIRANMLSAHGLLTLA